MPTPDRIVFTIAVPRTLPAETWQQFTTRARAEGFDPRAALRRLIEFYVAKGFPNDQDNQSGRLRQG